MIQYIILLFSSYLPAHNMPNIQTVIKHAEMQCKNHGARLTDKRKFVLSHLLKSKKAMSAYELADSCNKGDSKMPAMSVYRILEFLQSENLVHKLQLANKYIACSHIACEHEHETPQFLICYSCGDVKEIALSSKLISELKNTVEKAKYTLNHPQLELNCLCQSCS